MSLRILIIVPSYEPANVYGGPIRSISALCKGLWQQGHQVEVYTTNANGKNNLDLTPNETYMRDGVQVTYFSRWTGDHSNFSPGLLLKVFRNVSTFDIIHIHSWWNLVTIPSAWICYLNGIVPVISPRGSISNYTLHYRNAFIKRTFHSAIGRKWLKNSMVHCTTSKEEQEVALLVPGSKRCVIPNLIHLPEPLPGALGQTDKLRLVFLGRIDPVKNLDFLISMLAQISLVPFSLTIAGEGDPFYKQNLNALSRGQFQINWIGEVVQDDKFSLLADSDILVLPSHTENFGNVVFESLSQGTPVLVSPQVGASEYVATHQVGWVAETQTEKWISVLKHIWENKSYKGDIRTRAVQCVKEDFRSDRLVKEYLEMYHSIIEPSTTRTS